MSAVAPEANGTFSLLQLPLDLILLLAEQLPAEAIVTLSLSCKTLFGALAPLKFEPVVGARKQRLLTCLERDIAATHCFCPFCPTLHLLRSSCVRNQQPKCYEHAEWYSIPAFTIREFMPFSTWTDDTAALSYHMARSVMNRHFYGPSAGIPLDNLRWTSQLPPFDASLEAGGGMRTAVSFTAKVIQDELFLKTTYSLRTLHHKLPVHVRFNSQLGICPNRRVDTFMDWYEKILEASTSPDEPFNHQTTHYCDECLSDFTAEVSRKERMCTMTVDGYHRIGAVRSHLDTKWLMFVGSRLQVSLEDRTQMRQNYPGGTIRDLWETAPG